MREKEFFESLFGALAFSPKYGITTWTIGDARSGPDDRLGYDVDYQFLDADCPFIIIEKHVDELCLVILTSGGMSIVNPYVLRSMFHNDL